MEFVGCDWLLMIVTGWFCCFFRFSGTSRIPKYKTCSHSLDMPRPFRTAGLVAHWTPVRRPVDSVTKIRWVFHQQNWDFYGFLLVFSPIFPSSSTGWDVKSLRLGGRRAGATYPRLRRFFETGCDEMKLTNTYIIPQNRARSKGNPLNKNSN